MIFKTSHLKTKENQLKNQNRHGITTKMESFYLPQDMLIESI